MTVSIPEVIAVPDCGGEFVCWVEVSQSHVTFTRILYNFARSWILRGNGPKCPIFRPGYSFIAGLNKIV
jgi:hypothetical protein